FSDAAADSFRSARDDCGFVFEIHLTGARASLPAKRAQHAQIVSMENTIRASRSSGQRCPRSINLSTSLSVAHSRLSDWLCPWKLSLPDPQRIQTELLSLNDIV